MGGFGCNDGVCLNNLLDRTVCIKGDAMTKRFMRRPEAVMRMNLTIERLWRDEKKLEGFSTRQINKSIEKLEHLKAFHESMKRRMIENGKGEAP